MAEQDRSLKVEDIIYMPFDEVLSANGTVCPYRNAWWTCHPEKGLAFWCGNKRRRSLEHASPQCNHIEATARYLQQKLWPDHEVRQIPLVLVPLHMGNYDD
jgi:hypothetical protein